MTAHPKGIILDTKEEINTYAFLMIRRALAARVHRKMNLLKGREIEAARNYGWTQAFTAKQALADMNKIAETMGLEVL